MTTCSACKGHGRLGAGGICPVCQGSRSAACQHLEYVEVPVNGGGSPGSACTSYERIAVVCKEGRLAPVQPGEEGRLQGAFVNNPGRACPACLGTGQVACSYCGGTGISPGSEVCSACGGSGQVREPCARCGGSGIEEVAEPCPKCKGSGTVSRVLP